MKKNSNSSTTDDATQGLHVYIVGGAVRDALLGLPIGDRDWVVVGATPEMMIARGFLPVGGDFPVFLHPETREEYALARTERKSGRGYRGFTFYTGPHVTLEEDLKRRDLTINAMAQDEAGHFIDPLHAMQDVQARILKHVDSAFVEDPVRILRLARFAARFSDFTLASETVALCQAMVAAGEVDALVPERIWKELSRGLMTDKPSRFLQVLAQVQALPHLLPGLQVTGVLEAALDRAAQENLPLPSRYALLCYETTTRAALAASLRVPRICWEYARLLPDVLQGLQRLQAVTVSTSEGGAAELSLALLERCDAPRKPERFMDLLHAAAVLESLDLAAWKIKLHALQGIDAGAIARQCQGDPVRIKAALRAARLKALAL